MSITTAQIRGARGILDWSQTELAERTGISATSIGSIENGQTTPRANTLQTIQKAFEDAGIEFLGREGVKTRTGQIRTYTGQTGFHEFYDDIYYVARDQGGEFLVNNVDEKVFLKWGSDKKNDHIERMSKLKNLTYKIMVREGDYNFVANEYAEYRWLPKELFSSVPFYVYGKRLAILLLNAEPVIIVLDYPAVTEAYRRQFLSMWEQAKMPPEQYAENNKKTGS